MGNYTDLLITDDDLSLDAGGQPETVADLASIAQDIQHMIRETGLLVELIGNRDETAKASALVQLAIEVEDDERIVPGTCAIEETGLGEFYLTAETVEYGAVSLTLEH